MLENKGGHLPDVKSEYSDEESSSSWGPGALAERYKKTLGFQIEKAAQRAGWIQKNLYFYSQISHLLSFIIAPHSKVLSVRCETGFILDSVNPKIARGLDLSEEMVNEARKRFPNYEFESGNPSEVEVDSNYDYVIIDHIADTVDVIQLFQNLKRGVNPSSKVIVLNYNNWWRPIFKVAELFKLKMPLLEQNWLSDSDILNTLILSDYEPIKKFRIVLFPKYIPIVSQLINRFIAPLPIINRLCMLTVHVARPLIPPQEEPEPGVSIVVPCRNEAGNITHIIERCPKIGSKTELIFCDDKSTDTTKEEIKRLASSRNDIEVRLVDGPGEGKAKNVWTGFDAATQDILIILDADLAVMPEELPLFVKALKEKKAEFINGSRLVYPMPRGAMKITNMLGNKFFSLFFTFLLSQPVGDTLCGTKAFWRRDWAKFKQLLGDLGIEDKWGDYELLLSASRLQLKIIDLPVHYQERIFGSTKMVKVIQNGVRMLKICFAALFRYRLRYLGVK